MAQPVYLVIISIECNDNYYPDYDEVLGVYSTKEKAEEIKGKLLAKKYNARVDEYSLDEPPKELNED